MNRPVSAPLHREARSFAAAMAAPGTATGRAQEGFNDAICIHRRWPIDWLAQFASCVARRLTLRPRLYPFRQARRYVTMDSSGPDSAGEQQRHEIDN